MKGKELRILIEKIEEAQKVKLFYYELMRKEGGGKHHADYSVAFSALAALRDFADAVGVEVKDFEGAAYESQSR